jgi:hypothetical protein
MDAGNALERWRTQLNVTTEQEGPAEEGAAPDGGEQEPEVAAAEYEYMADGEGTRRGDTQVMAPATEDQAAVAELPDPAAGVDADETTEQVRYPVFIAACCKCGKGIDYSQLHFSQAMGPCLCSRSSTRTWRRSLWQVGPSGQPTR